MDFVLYSICNLVCWSEKQCTSRVAQWSAFGAFLLKRWEVERFVCMFQDVVSKIWGICVDSLNSFIE